MTRKKVIAPKVRRRKPLVKNVDMEEPENGWMIGPAPKDTPTKAANAKD